MGHFRQHALPIPQKAQRPDLMSRMNRAGICWKKLLDSLMWFDNKVDHLQILQPMSNHLVSNGIDHASHAGAWMSLLEMMKRRACCFICGKFYHRLFHFSALVSVVLAPMSSAKKEQEWKVKNINSSQWNHITWTWTYILHGYFWLFLSSSPYLAPHKTPSDDPSCWPQAIQQSSPGVDMEEGYHPPCVH